MEEKFRLNNSQTWKKQQQQQNPHLKLNKNVRKVQINI